MWTCPRCGEQHGDQFTECWKCVGAAAQAQFAATPLPPAHPEPRLRPLSAVLKRAFIGFCVGAVLTMLFANFIDIRQLHASWPELSFLGTSFLSLIVGLAVGGMVGVFVWVIFPYEPTSNAIDPTERKPG
jgi:hypothetical protein